MNFRILLRHLFTALFISASNIVYAQVYPVQANVQIQPPYSTYLTDYTSPGSQRLVLQLNANDITISDHPIKLRLTIEGLGITIRTKQNFIPQQLILSGGGITTILYGEDLLEYFNPNNFDFAGLTRKEFLQTGKLPEGVYRFSIEVFSYNRDVQLSNRATTTAWIILNDPPLLNLPRKDAKVKILDPTNIAFTWTPRHTGSPNAAFSTEYIFKLVEIWPENKNPNDAFLSQPALYEETITQTQIVYGMQHPALLPGRKYAWSVQARDVDGRDLFKNQGKSEVFVFQFGDALSAPENIKQDVSNATTVTLSWELPSQGGMPQQYRIQYRKKGTLDNTWYESLTEQRWVTLSSLQSNTSYEIQIRSEAKPQLSEYSALQYVQTKEESTLPYTCGVETATSPADNASPLLILSAGDVIAANNFKVIVTEANGQNGTFSGKGVMAVPFFNMANVNVNFSSVQVNSKYQLVAGEILTVYNPGSELARKVEEAHKIGEEKPEPPQSSDSTSATTAITIDVPGVIDSIYFDAEKGEIVVVDEEGNTNTYKQPIGEQSKEPMPVIITDSDGNSYAVQKDQATGETTITKVEGGSNTNTTVQADPIKDRIIVLILEQFEEEIAAWLRINGKGGEDDPDVYLAEELASCFQKDAGQLRYTKEKTIPYFKAHPAELVEKVESNQTHKDLFDRISKHFSNSSDIDFDKQNEADKDSARNATCKALTNEIAPLVSFYEKVKPLVSDGDYISALKQIKAIYEFFNTCNNEGWESYNGEGIIPYCFWRDQSVSSGLYYSNADLPFTSGLIDGAYIEAEGLYHLPDVVRDITKLPAKVMYAYTKAYIECRTGVMMEKLEKYDYVMVQLEEMEEEGGPLNWAREIIHDYEGQNEKLVEYFKDCKDADDLRATIADLHELAINWETIKTLSQQVFVRLDNYWNTVSSTDNIGRYYRGRMVIPAATIIVPFGIGVASKAEKLKNSLKLLKESSAENWKKFVGRIGELISLRLYKNIPFDDFAKTVPEFANGANNNLAQRAYQLWGEEKWDELYKLFDEHNLNGKWPPFNGAKSIIKTESGSQLSGKVFDRFQKSEELSGGYASPVLNSNEGVNDLVFTYDSRALANKIEEGTYYIKFKLKETLPTDLYFEYGETIPWFNLQGNADQIKSSWNLNKLLKADKVDVLEILKYENKKWIKIK